MAAINLAKHIKNMPNTPPSVIFMEAMKALEEDLPAEPHESGCGCDGCQDD